MTYKIIVFYIAILSQLARSTFNNLLFDLNVDDHVDVTLHIHYLFNHVYPTEL